VANNVIFVECVECNRSATIFDDNADGVPDSIAASRFRKLGWSVKPTLCPEHNTKEGRREASRKYDYSQVDRRQARWRPAPLKEEV
jgi:hypothetical protein